MIDCASVSDVNFCPCSIFLYQTCTVGCAKHLSPYAIKWPHMLAVLLLLWCMPQPVALWASWKGFCTFALLLENCLKILFWWNVVLCKVWGWKSPLLQKRGSQLKLSWPNILCQKLLWFMPIFVWNKYCLLQNCFIYFFKTVIAKLLKWEPSVMLKLVAQWYIALRCIGSK